MTQKPINRTLTLAGVVRAGKLAHWNRSLLPVLALCFATVAWSQTAPGQYRFVSIDIPGATGSGPGLPGALAYGIDNAGVVTGLYNDANNITHGFAWRAGTLKTVDNPGAAYTALSSVSNQAVAMGYYGDLTTAHAAMYSFASDTWTMLPDIAGMPNNEGYGINKSGVAVGVAGAGDFNYPSTVTAWIWDPNSQSYSFFAAPGAQPNSTYDAAINDSGQVVGSFVDASGATHGYLKDGDTYTAIDVTRATATLPNGINNSGTIAGGWGNNSVPLAGFVRTSDGVFTVVRFPGAVDTEIGGINDHGDICGFWAAPNATVYKAFVGYKQ